MNDEQEMNQHGFPIKSSEVVEEVPQPAMTVEEVSNEDDSEEIVALAKEVISGKWGRSWRPKLHNRGYDVRVIQAEIDRQKGEVT